MTILIFAGGAGTRLWPLSRRNSPKQFGKLAQDLSTLEMALNRVRHFGLDQIFIATTVDYIPLVLQNAPGVTTDHIIAEPARRDLAAAVLFSLLRLKQQGKSGPTAILWSDHFMEHPDAFATALERGEKLIESQPDRFVFLGEKPRFANHNLGWIKHGQEIAPDLYTFEAWKYHPDVKTCEAMFESGEWLWNPGYFIFDLEFVLRLYQSLQPTLYATLSAVMNYTTALDEEYRKLPALSFDQAILEHLRPEQGVVIPVNLGWSDPGTLYALKEALVGSGEANYVRGNTVLHDTKDSFIYNEDTHKLIATIGISGLVVVNTKDCLLVCPKDRVPDIKQLLKSLEEDGQEQYL